MDDDASATRPDDADLKRLMRSVQVGDSERLPVPADLWARIEDAVAPEPSTAADPDREPAASSAAVVTPIRHRRHFGIAAVIGLAAALAVGVWLVQRHDGGPREVASIELSNEGLAAFPTVPSGSARLIDDRGHLFLDVDVQNAPVVGDDYIELWMIDRDVKGMVSLGPYHGHDRYEVPAGVSPVNFPVVDVSVEPIDGLPTHSGVSIVRGVFSS